MLRIQRNANGEIVFIVAGRLEADNVPELSGLLAAEPAGRTLVMDLKDLVLVNQDIVRFLRSCESQGVVLRNCPSYIREWIARDAEQR